VRATLGREKSRPSVAPLANRRGTWRRCLAAIYQRGLNAIVDAATARSIVGVLEEHGYVRRLPAGMELDGAPRRDAWGAGAVTGFRFDPWAALKIQRGDVPPPNPANPSNRAEQEGNGLGALGGLGGVPLHARNRGRAPPRSTAPRCAGETSVRVGAAHKLGNRSRAGKLLSQCFDHQNVKQQAIGTPDWSAPLTVDRIRPLI
jgi:hypothetical protein